MTLFRPLQLPLAAHFGGRLPVRDDRVIGTPPSPAALASRAQENES